MHSNRYDWFLAFRLNLESSETRLRSSEKPGNSFTVMQMYKSSSPSRLVCVLILAVFASESSAQVKTEPIEISNVISELKTLAQSEFGATAAAAIKSLRAFCQVTDSIYRKPATKALEELQTAAEEWGKKYRDKSIKGSYTFNGVKLTHKELINLHLLQPESIAFIGMPDFTDYDLAAIDLLESLENLTVQDCPRFKATVFRTIRLPNLKIVHLNGSGDVWIDTYWIQRKEISELKLVNLKNTPVNKVQMERLTAYLKKSKRDIAIKH